jgi:hypothetical protein
VKYLGGYLFPAQSAVAGLLLFLKAQWLSITSLNVKIAR